VSQPPGNSLTDDTKIDHTLSSASKGSGDKDKIIRLERNNLFGSDAEQGWTVSTKASGAT